jgi:hypothetical protein
VHHTGEMLERSVNALEVLEDYPYFEPKNLEFAHLFVLISPDNTTTTDQ